MTVTVTALLLDKFQDNVPKGASRKLLEQEKGLKRLFVSKCDTYEEIDQRISGAFVITEYKFLECIMAMM